MNYTRAAHPTHMRIAHVTATFPPYKGGTGNVCYYNALELARLGHDVHVFTAAVPGAPQTEVLSGVHVHRLHPLMQIGNAPVLPSLLSTLRGFDLIHLHYPFIGGPELVSAAAALYRTAFVITFHNDLIGEGSRARLFAFYQRLSIRLTVRQADMLCAVSLDHYQHSQLRRALTPARPPARPPAVDVPNGVDTTLFHPLDQSAVHRWRDQHAIPYHAPLFLFVAALDRAHHFKGLARLLEAFAALRNTDPAVDPSLATAARLLIVGDGDLRPRYEALSGKLGIADRTIFVGALPHAETAPYFAAADITVLPSSPPESFGLVLVESMACGTPVVASDIPGVRTVVHNGLDGWLVQQASTPALTEALRFMLTMSPEQRGRMGDIGRADVQQRYAWPRIGAQLQSIYQDLLLAPRCVGEHKRQAQVGG